MRLPLIRPVFRASDSAKLTSTLDPISRAASLELLDLDLGQISWDAFSYLRDHERVGDVLVFIVALYLEDS